MTARLKSHPIAKYFKYRLLGREKKYCQFKWCKNHSCVCKAPASWTWWHVSLVPSFRRQGQACLNKWNSYISYIKLWHTERDHMKLMLHSRPVWVMNLSCCVVCLCKEPVFQFAMAFHSTEIEVPGCPMKADSGYLGIQNQRACLTLAARECLDHVR